MIESEALLKKICSSLNDRYKMFLEEDYKTILSSFLNHSVFPPGAAIKVRSDKRSITGIFKGIDQQGRLLIDNGDRMQSIVEGRISAVVVIIEAVHSAASKKRKQDIAPKNIERCWRQTERTELGRTTNSPE